MIKVLFADSHFGTKQNSITWLNSQLDFIYNELIPTIDKLRQRDNVKLIHLGDVFDSRSTLSTIVASRLVDAFKELRGHVDQFIIIGGNHDYYSPTTDDINSLNLILHNSDIRLITNALDVDEVYDPQSGSDLYVPWYEWLDQEKLKKYITDFNEHCIVCEPIKNIYTHADIVNEYVDPFFDNFNIYSGHVHTPDIKKGKYNLGSCYALAFADANEERGFYVDDGTLHFVPNKKSIRFWRLYNDDIFDDDKVNAMKSGDYIEMYINQTNLILDRYTKKLDALAKKFPKNRWIIPQIEAVIPDDSIDTFTGYDIEATCRKHVMTHPELEGKFNAIVDALISKPE